MSKIKTIEELFEAKSYHEILTTGLKYIDDRRKGIIKSIKTPWAGFNKAGVNGLEWGSMLTIGARPGAGKTLIVGQILRESFILNPDQKFNILEFQFEMGANQTAAREFAAQTALDYNIVLSTDKELDDYSYARMLDVAAEEKQAEDNGYIRKQINTPLTHHDIRTAVHLAYNQYGCRPMIITIDHSWLIKKSSDEKEKISTLYNTVEMLMRLKNELPLIIIMVTQLNRTIEDAARKTAGSIANYPTSSDIFGGDALMQGSDVVMVLNRPAKNDIGVYGPKGYLVKDDDIFVHLLKVRNGSDDVNLLFMKAQFNRQKMIEVGEPAGSNTQFVRRSQRPRNTEINVDEIN